MNQRLEDLLAAARRVTMTPQEEEQQRRSFAYGNTNIENEQITREMTEQAAQELAHEK